MIHHEQRQKAYNVYLYDNWIDTVYFDNDTPVTAEEVRESLIKKDGYDPNILVTERGRRIYV